jgi:uncharacterized protein (TIGR02646 family)
MRRVDRSQVDVPKVFVGPTSEAAKERLKAEAHVAAQTSGTQTAKKRKSYPFDVYKNDAIRRALEDLFHGKCAYCESEYRTQAPVDIEHFRPKAEIEDDDKHPGYWWLAADWENLLPSCIDCNRSRNQLVASLDQDTAAPNTAVETVGTTAFMRGKAGKANAFPIAGKRASKPGDSIKEEDACLLDPCRDDPAVFLRFLLEPAINFGVVLPSPNANANGTEDEKRNYQRAIHSIRLYGLNRLGLVQARARILQRLTFLRLLIEDLEAFAVKLEASTDPNMRGAVRVINRLVESIVEEIRKMSKPDQPYSAMVQQWIRNWVK